MNSNNITPGQQMLSSCTGAFLTSLFVTPLDVVKVRLQAQQKELHRKCLIYCNAVVQDLCYCFNSNVVYPQAKPSMRLTGTLDAFSKIVRSEGITSLWSGLPPTLVMSIPATVVYFTVYDQMRDALAQGDKTPKLWVPVVAGSLARVVAASTVSPIEMVRTKMQSQKYTYNEVNKALRSLVEVRGVKSLWRGLGPTVWRDVPFSAIYWSTYESLKKYNQATQPTFVFSFAAGAFAGGVASIMTTPFDVVKTHQQIDLGNKASLKKHSGSITVLYELFLKQGYKGLFVGTVPRLVKIAPACAIMISSYEYGKKFFRQYNASQVANIN